MKNLENSQNTQTKTKNSTRNSIIALIVLCILISATLTARYLLAPKAVEGAKTITVDIIYDDTLHRVIINTDALFLRQALDEKGLIDGEESPFGFWVQSVDGRLADEENQEWWSLNHNGEFAMYGVDELPVEDGDSFSFILMVGYDFE